MRLLLHKQKKANHLPGLQKEENVHKVMNIIMMIQLQEFQKLEMNEPRTSTDVEYPLFLIV